MKRSRRTLDALLWYAGLISLIVGLFLILLSVSRVHAAVISMTVRETSGVARTGEYVRRGVPLAVNDNVTSTAGMKITTDWAGDLAVDAQFHILARWDIDGDGADASDPIRVVLVVFAADVPANAAIVYYLHTDGGSGTAEGSNLVSDQTGFHQIDTGPMQVRLSESAGFNFFDRVTVNGVDTVSSASTDGLICRVGGTDFTSYNSNDPAAIVIEYNGPLMACVSVEGKLEDGGNNELAPSAGSNPVVYKIWYWAYKNERIIRPVITLKNENDGYYANGYGTHDNFDIDYLYIRTSLSMGQPTAVRFGPGLENGAAFSDTSSPSGIYTIDMNHPAHGADNTTRDDFAVMNYDVGAYPGARTESSDRFDSYAQLRDASGGIMVASRWFWENYWKEIRLDATAKRIDFYLWADEAFDHTFVGGTWKTHELLYHFHGDLASTYGFGRELASIKNRLRVYNSTDFSTGYYYRLPPKAVVSDVTFNSDPNQRMQPAIDFYDATLQARFDAGFSTSASAASDIDDLRRNRPFSWDRGIYNGNFINWYGWRDFGDLVRGSGTYGFGGQNYDWCWYSRYTGMRLESGAISEIADQFTRHYGDALIIHNPSSSTTDVSTGCSIRDVHGGQRGETDAHYQVGNFVVGNAGNQPADHGHTWPSGFLWSYLVNGDPWILDVAVHIADHALFKCSATPRHATQTSANRICETGTCYNGVPETRQYSRIIPVLIDLWKIFGDGIYYTAAKNVFLNGVLPNEYECTQAVKSGFMSFNMFASGRLQDSWVGYDSFLTLDLIQLWRAANTTGDIHLQSSIESFLTRQATWVRDELYAKWAAAEDCGDYSAGMYFPYQVPQGHVCDASENGVGQDWGHYSLAFAQGFAFLFERTGSQPWLDLARAAWKDFYSYDASSLSVHHYVPEVTSDPIPNVPGITALPGSAWLKDAKQLRVAAYTLAVEYAVQNAQPPYYPQCIITSPTSDPTFDNGNHAAVDLAGTATDDVNLNRITWNNTTTGDADLASGTQNWFIEDIPLAQGDNVIVVTAWDDDDNTGTDQITITRNAGLAGISVSPTSGLTVDEGGGTDSFTVILASQPSGDVTIKIDSDDTGEGLVSPKLIVFTTADWNTAQTVTVTGVDDGVQDGDQTFTIILAPAESSDSNYDGLDPEDVSAVNTEDNAADTDNGDGSGGGSGWFIITVSALGSI
jgi:hypothetical protein